MGIFEACPLCAPACLRVCSARRRGAGAPRLVSAFSGSPTAGKRRADLAASRGRRYFSVRLNVGRSVSADGALTRSPSDNQSRLLSVLVFPSFAPCDGGRSARQRSSADIRNSPIDSLFCLSSIWAPRSHSG